MRKKEQNIINEIARNTFIAEKFGKVRGDLIREHKQLVNDHEAEFRDGVPAEFEYDGLRIKCKLTMTPSPKWSDKEVVIIDEKTKRK